MVIKMKDDTNPLYLDYFYSAVLTLKTKEECAEFFDDVCTRQELGSITQRLKIASMLSQGAVYSRIVAETGASTAIVSRVKRSMSQSGRGYAAVFGRLGEKK